MNAKNMCRTLQVHRHVLTSFARQQMKPGGGESNTQRGYMIHGNKWVVTSQPAQQDSASETFPFAAYAFILHIYICIYIYMYVCMQNISPGCAVLLKLCRQDPVWHLPADVYKWSTIISFSSCNSESSASETGHLWRSWRMVQKVKAAVKSDPTWFIGPASGRSNKSARTFLMSPSGEDRSTVTWTA